MTVEAAAAGAVNGGGGEGVGGVILLFMDDALGCFFLFYHTRQVPQFRTPHDNTNRGKEAKSDDTRNNRVQSGRMGRYQTSNIRLEIFFIFCSDSSIKYSSVYMDPHTLYN